MKKIWILLIAGVVLGAVALYINSTRSNSTIDRTLSDFSIERTEAIDKIFIADQSGDRILLEKQPNGTWQLNGEFRAKDNSVELLLNTFKHIEVKRPVPRSKRETVIRNIATKNRKVEVYKGGDEPAKTYYLGTPTKAHNGTYMLLEIPGSGRSDVPYVVHIPGEQGFLNPRFFMSEKEWRYTGVYGLDPREIQSIEVIHHLEPRKSFRLEYGGGNDITIFSRQSGEPVTIFDTLHVKDFMHYFEKVHVETYDHGLDSVKVDSIVNSGPIYTVRVTDTTGSETSVQAFKKAAPKTQQKVDGRQQMVEADLNRMYALVNGERFAVIQNFVFDRIFKGLPDFQKKEHYERPGRYIKRKKPGRSPGKRKDSAEPIP